MLFRSRTYVPSNTGTADGSDYDCETDIGIYEDNYSITEKPCVKLRTKSLEPLFKGKVDSLNKPAVYSLNYESGFFQTKASATTSTLYPKAAPLPNTHTITYVPPSSVSLVHVHNDTFIDELGDERHTVKMLSPGDLFTFMGKFQDNALAAGVPAEDTYAMMISRQGTYCLKITASGPLTTLSREQKSAFFKEYDKNAKILYSDLELTDTANQDKLEHLLLDLLKEFFLDDKIGLFKATNADLTEWNQKKLNTAGVIETVPCI